MKIRATFDVTIPDEYAGSWASEDEKERAKILQSWAYKLDVAVHEAVMDRLNSLIICGPMAWNWPVKIEVVVEATTLGEASEGTLCVECGHWFLSHGRDHRRCKGNYGDKDSCTCTDFAGPVNP